HKGGMFFFRDSCSRHVHHPFMLQEYPIKSFERSFELSERADQEKISAQMVDGVVVITVLKTKAAQRPDVEVSIA
ncbi:MAG: Hsp20/alpha crystallin family protein, partial [Bacteroidota bacterium]